MEIIPSEGKRKKREKPTARNMIAASGSTTPQRYPTGVRPYRVDISRSVMARILRMGEKCTWLCRGFEVSRVMAESEFGMKNHVNSDDVELRFPPFYPLAEYPYRLVPWDRR